MSQHFTLVTTEVRRNAATAIFNVPNGSRVEIKGPRRTVDQNALMWVLLGKMSERAKHPISGKVLSDTSWKCLFAEALHYEDEPELSLDGERLVPMLSTSNFTVEQASNMIELIYAHAANHGVNLED